MPDLVGPPVPVPPIVRHLEEVRQRHAPLHPALKYGPAAASFYDALATHMALGQGGREANPVLAPFVDNEPLFYATKLGSGLVTGLAADALAKKGHRNWAKVLASFGIGVPLSAGTHNLIAAGSR